MKVKTYCFDFDGTIADTVPIITGTMRGFLKERKEREDGEKFLQMIRDGGVEEALEDTNIPRYKLFFLYREVRKRMEKEISEAVVKEGMKDVICNLKKDGNRLGILTSNSQSNVIGFLKKNDLLVFDFIKESGLFGKGRELKKLKRKGGIFIYIGDEVRDIKAGKKAGAITIAVPWGLGLKKSLSRSGPNVLIEKPVDLLKLSF